MAEQYKSVLEKHNENRTHRVPTAEEEAIEPVYPEEYLVGGPGKAAASGLRSSTDLKISLRLDSSFFVFGAIPI